MILNRMSFGLHQLQALSSLPFHAHLISLNLERSLFLRSQDKDHGWALFAWRAPRLYCAPECTWRFQGILSCIVEQKGAFSIINSVTDWNTGSCVKVVGLGTRASSALQFCHESALIPSAEFWVSSGDGLDVQSFGLLNKTHLKIVNGQTSHGERNIVVFVLGMGANLCGKEALEMLQSSRLHGALSVMIIIQPFNFEGSKRKKEIETLAESMLEHIDLCLVFEHDVLFKRERLTFAEALKVADSTVLYATKSISDFTLGNQLKVFDAPPEGVRDISGSEILSMLAHAGNTWAGFASSYSIKAAVQRAAFESPFLQGLKPGVKALVACTISSADEKGRKDIQTALHALRCAIGPRAQLLCTSVKEPTLKRGLVLATILLTRIDSGGGSDVLKQYTTFPEVSSRFNLLTNGSGGVSTSMNGRELRKTPLEGPAENSETRPSKLKSQEASEPLLLSDVDDSEADPLILSNICNSNVASNTLHESDAGESFCQTPTDEAKGDDIKSTNKVMTADFQSLQLDTLDNDNTILIASSRSSGVHTSYQSMYEEEGLEKQFESTIREVVEKNIVDESSQESFPADFEGQIDYYEKQGAEQSSVLEKDIDEKWSFPSLFSIIKGGREIVNGEKKSPFGWESGPYSTAAEAWAQTRQRLGSLGNIEKNKSYRFPVGVRATSDLENETFTFGREESKDGDSLNQLPLLNFATPLKRVLNSGLEVVADMYNVASAKIFKKDESEDAKQLSSHLSERAASMLESERSSKKLPPVVEMQFKNGMYKGRCQGGLPEGKGRLSYKDGSFYFGLWKQGKRAGIGSFYYANGDVFQGYWRDDQKHGKGWFYFHTGDRLYADFWKGKANGEGRYYTAKGDVSFGYFRENWRHGESLSIESGVRWSEVWDQGILISRSRFEEFDKN